MKNKLPQIPYETIIAAMNKDENALRDVLDIFTPYIKKLATKCTVDNFGNYTVSTNEDLIAYIQSKLVMGIIKNFKILPENK